VSEFVERHGKESEPEGWQRRLDNFFARIITRCKVLHFVPNCSRADPGRISGTAE
jgi:hypothetical protein